MKLGKKKLIVGMICLILCFSMSKRSKTRRSDFFPHVC